MILLDVGDLEPAGSRAQAFELGLTLPPFTHICPALAKLNMP